MDKTENPYPSDGPKTNPAIVLINKALVALDDLILFTVALGIAGVALLLIYEAITDFVFYTQHSISHIINDLMFVLIIMELLRQVLRQINRHAFSLNPFIYIGVIASVRGILLNQMKLGMGEGEWTQGVILLAVHAFIVLVLIRTLRLFQTKKQGRGLISLLRADLGDGCAVPFIF